MYVKSFFRIMMLTICPVSLSFGSTVLFDGKNQTQQTALTQIPINLSNSLSSDCNRLFPRSISFPNLGYPFPGDCIHIPNEIINQNPKIHNRNQLSTQIKLSRIPKTPTQQEEFSFSQLTYQKSESVLKSSQRYPTHRSSDACLDGSIPLELCPVSVGDCKPPAQNRVHFQYMGHQAFVGDIISIANSITASKSHSPKRRDLIREVQKIKNRLSLKRDTSKSFLQNERLPVSITLFPITSVQKPQSTHLTRYCSKTTRKKIGWWTEFGTRLFPGTLASIALTQNPISLDYLAIAHFVNAIPMGVEFYRENFLSRLTQNLSDWQNFNWGELIRYFFKEAGEIVAGVTLCTTHNPLVCTIAGSSLMIQGICLLREGCCLSDSTIPLPSTQPSNPPQKINSERSDFGSFWRIPEGLINLTGGILIFHAAVTIGLINPPLHEIDCRIMGAGYALWAVSNLWGQWRGRI
jgi:hypothetical protein